MLGLDNAGTNKAASSGTSLNTKRLDDDTENLARKSIVFVFCRQLCFIFLILLSFVGCLCNDKLET